MSETRVCISLETYTEIYELLSYIGYYDGTDICDGNKLRVASDKILGELDRPENYTEL